MQIFCKKFNRGFILEMFLIVQCFTPNSQKSTLFKVIVFSQITYSSYLRQSQDVVGNSKYITSTLQSQNHTEFTWPRELQTSLDIPYFLSIFCVVLQIISNDSFITIIFFFRLKPANYPTKDYIVINLKVAVSGLQSTGANKKSAYLLWLPKCRKT